MNVDFEEYKNWIKKFDDNKDTREINYENDVVKRLLEKLYPDYDIVRAGTKGPESENHDYYAYSGEYEDKNGKKKPTTPDLLICKNWNWYNKKNEITYIATVEVKSPYGIEAIYKKDFEEYSEELYTKIKRHLSARQISKVILTDTLKWEFYKDTLDSHEEIVLADCILGSEYTYEWRSDANSEFQNLKKKLGEFLQE